LSLYWCDKVASVTRCCCLSVIVFGGEGQIDRGHPVSPSPAATGGKLALLRCLQLLHTPSPGAAPSAQPPAPCMHQSAYFSGRGREPVPVYRLEDLSLGVRGCGCGCGCGCGSGRGGPTCTKPGMESLGYSYPDTYMTWVMYHEVAAGGQTLPGSSL
jgi:hypothetical protein